MADRDCLRGIHALADPAALLATKKMEAKRKQVSMKARKYSLLSELLDRWGIRDKDGYKPIVCRERKLAQIMGLAALPVVILTSLFVDSGWNQNYGDDGSLTWLFIGGAMLYGYIIPGLKQSEKEWNDREYQEYVSKSDQEGGRPKDSVR